MLQEAMLYTKRDDQKVECHLCAHRCVISPERRGICQVRENRAGTLYSLADNQIISRAVDPVEKKPLYHFYPGTTAYSVATVGCNFRCAFCQNYEISQMPRDQGRILGQEIPPKDIVAGAQHYGCKSIAYTYTEPTVAYELTYECAKLAHERGIKNIYVTNGYMTHEMLAQYHPYLDAANVDLKAFTEEFYHKMCGAHLQPVLDSLKLMKQYGIWVEVTTLIIPTLNDSDAELRDIAGFIAHELGPGTPWHVSRFHPTYRLLDKPVTPVETLARAREIGLEAGLRYVYEGNVPGHGGEDTICYNCGERVIRRWGFSVLERRIINGRCAKCGTQVDGVGL